ncbi:MAG: PadR family transcriptional regulator [Caldiserica bacterium CG_4_8_14_3_um_filter_35_18]|nr:PadR family transcriptional regulator [Caldisericota bacterium]NCQ52999.1 PadR family transcriptional regulator [Caldisericota bacterium]PIX28596.1 MAG: PadR family transcriptional regulator [Caldiserica bacterium CG_4_8_14_3_um_filter_35_18]
MREKFKGCKGIGFKSSNILLVSILYSLLSKPSYGYSLLDEIKEIGIDTGEIPYGILYRTLRLMETDGLVESEWQIEETGPSKRIYKITDQGKAYLLDWAKIAKKRVDKILDLVIRIEKVLSDFSN